MLDSNVSKSPLQPLSGEIDPSLDIAHQVVCSLSSSQEGLCPAISVNVSPVLTTGQHRIATRDQTRNIPISPCEEGYRAVHGSNQSQHVSDQAGPSPTTHRQDWRSTSLNDAQLTPQASRQQVTATNDCIPTAHLDEGRRIVSGFSQSSLEMICQPRPVILTDEQGNSVLNVNQTAFQAASKLIRATEGCIPTTPCQERRRSASNVNLASQEGTPLHTMETSSQLSGHIDRAHIAVVRHPQSTPVLDTLATVEGKVDALMTVVRDIQEKQNFILKKLEHLHEEDTGELDFDEVSLPLNSAIAMDDMGALLGDKTNRKKLVR